MISAIIAAPISIVDKTAQLQRKREELQKQHEDYEVKDCTFKPQIN